MELQRLPVPALGRRGVGREIEEAAERPEDVALARLVAGRPIELEGPLQLRAGAVERGCQLGVGQPFGGRVHDRQHPGVGVVVERVRDRARIACVLPDAQRFAIPAFGGGVVGLPVGDAADRLGELRSEVGLEGPGLRRHPIEAGPGLVQIAALLPESPQRVGHPDGDVGIGGIGRPIEGRPQIVMLALESVEPCALFGPAQFGGGALGELLERHRMASGDGVGFAGRGEHLRRVLADRVEHREARLVELRSIDPHEALVDERPDPLEEVQPELRRPVRTPVRRGRDRTRRGRPTADRGAAAARRRAGRSSTRSPRAGSVAARAGRASPPSTARDGARVERGSGRASGA